MTDPTPCATHLARGEFSWEWRGKKEKFRTCPANVADTSLIPIFNLYAAWQDGFLWHDGGLAKQPAAYVQAVNLISSEVAKIEKAKNEGRKGSVSIPKRAQRKMR